MKYLQIQAESIYSGTQMPANVPAEAVQENESQKDPDSPTFPGRENARMSQENSLNLKLTQFKNSEIKQLTT